MAGIVRLAAFQDMNKPDKKLWEGITPEAQALLRTREYLIHHLADRLRDPGVEATSFFRRDRKDSALKAAWIPGVEIFARTVHAQPYRGVFGEFVRRDEGVLKEIGLWPVQWAAARMFAGSAKGFHIHPPSIPDGADASGMVCGNSFPNRERNHRSRPYDKEQWDVMFFVQGRVEVLLRDARAGLDTRVMRFFIDGDNHRGRNNAGVVVPAGVAHAMRVEGSEDVIMVYGTSTSFHPEFEGRIASEIETASLAGIVGLIPSVVIADLFRAPRFWRMKRRFDPAVAGDHGSAAAGFDRARRRSAQSPAAQSLLWQLLV